MLVVQGEQINTQDPEQNENRPSSQHSSPQSVVVLNPFLTKKSQLLETLSYGHKTLGEVSL